MAEVPDLVLDIELDTSVWDEVMARLGQHIQLVYDTTPRRLGRGFLGDLALVDEASFHTLASWHPDHHVDQVLVDQVRDQAAADEPCRAWSVPTDEGWAMAQPHPL